MNRHQLRRALDELEADGTLDEAARGRVETRLERDLPPERDTAAVLAGIVATVGVLLIATGIVHFVATHWDEIPKAAKLAGVFVAILGFHHFGFRLAEEPGGWPRVGVALTAGGVLLFGAGLSLLAELYHLTPSPTGFLLWWATSLPFVLLTRSRVVLTLVGGLFTVWVIWRATVWLDHRDLGRDLHVLVGLSALAAAYAALFAGLAGLASAPGGARRAWPAAASWLRSFAVPAAFLSLYALSFHDVVDADLVVDGRLFVPALVLGAAAAIVLLVARGRGAGRGDALEGVAYLALGGAVAGLLRLTPGAAWIGLNVLLLIGLVVLVARGARTGRPELVNLGLLGIFVLALTRYFELLAERLRHGFLAFLGAGVVLLGVGFVLERKRRALVRRAREVRS